MEDEESIADLCDRLVASNMEIQLQNIVLCRGNIDRITPFCWLKIHLILHINLPRTLQG